MQYEEYTSLTRTARQPSPAATQPILLRSIRLKKRVIVGITRPARRLERVDVVSPLASDTLAFTPIHLVPSSDSQSKKGVITTHPRPSSPPQSPRPHVAVLREVVQQALDGRLADAVGAAGELAEDPLLAVGPEPGRGAGDALHADVGAHARRRRARAVRVEVLVHLVHELVLRVG